MPDYLGDSVYIIVADDVPDEPGSVVGLGMQIAERTTLMPCVTSDVAVLDKMIEACVRARRKFRVLRFGDREDVTSRFPGGRSNDTRA